MWFDSSEDKLRHFNALNNQCSHFCAFNIEFFLFTRKFGKSFLEFSNNSDQMFRYDISRPAEISEGAKLIFLYHLD